MRCGLVSVLTSLWSSGRLSETLTSEDNDDDDDFLSLNVHSAIFQLY